MLPLSLIFAFSLLCRVSVYFNLNAIIYCTIQYSDYLQYLFFTHPSLCLLQKELHNGNCPYMTAYKLVTVHFRWWGLQGRVENFIHKVIHQHRYMVPHHQQKTGSTYSIRKKPLP